MNPQFKTFRNSVYKVIKKYFPKCRFEHPTMLGVKSVHGEWRQRHTLNKSLYVAVAIPPNDFPEKGYKKHMTNFKRELKKKFHVVSKHFECMDTYNDGTGCMFVEVLSKDYK